MSRFVNWIRVRWFGEHSDAPVSQRHGDLGEAAAEAHLKAKGFKMLARNYRSDRGEIDLVLRDRDCLVFTEVKARSDVRWTRPAAAVDRDKRRRLSAAALDYLCSIGNPEVAIRFDIVEVILANGEVDQVRHLPHCFEMEAPYRYG